MWIVTNQSMALVNLDKCNHVFLSEKSDAVLVSAVLESSGKPVTICKCNTVSGATGVIDSIAAAIDADQFVFDTPDNFMDRETVIKDARVKRRGGS